MSDTKYRYFAFTINNPTQSAEETMEDFKKRGAKQMVFQLEVGEKGTPHYQGMVGFANPRYEKAVSKEFKMWCKALPDAIDRVKYKQYCQKERTKEAGPWGFGYKEFKVEQNDWATKFITELRPWQQECLNKLLEEPDNRTIHWYWEKTGNVGKTVFAKYLCGKHNALVVGGRAEDMKCAIARMKKDEKPAPRICIMLLARQSENKCSYKGLEEVKDGLFFSPKYESDMVVMDSPHVIVFANFPPQMELLSADRWNIVEINEN